MGANKMGRTVVEETSLVYLTETKSRVKTTFNTLYYGGDMLCLASSETDDLKLRKVAYNIEKLSSQGVLKLAEELFAKARVPSAVYIEDQGVNYLYTTESNKAETIVVGDKETTVNLVTFDDKEAKELKELADAGLLVAITQENLSSIDLEEELKKTYVEEKEPVPASEETVIAPLSFISNYSEEETTEQVREAHVVSKVEEEKKEDKEQKLDFVHQVVEPTQLTAGGSQADKLKQLVIEQEEAEKAAKVTKGEESSEEVEESSEEVEVPEVTTADSEATIPPVKIEKDNTEQKVVPKVGIAGSEEGVAGVKEHISVLKAVMPTNAPKKIYVTETVEPVVQKKEESESVRVAYPTSQEPAEPVEQQEEPPVRVTDRNKVQMTTVVTQDITQYLEMYSIYSITGKQAVFVTSKGLITIELPQLNYIPQPMSDAAFKEVLETLYTIERELSGEKPSNMTRYHKSLMALLNVSSVPLV